jgi:hypothetical protein
MVVERLVFGREGNLNESLPEGTIIVARIKDEQTLFYLEDKLVSGLLAEALSEVASIPSQQTVDDNALYGTTQRQAVGDSWPVNTKAFTHRMEEIGMAVQEDQVDGVVKLEAIKEIDGVECLYITSVTKITDYSISDLPAGVAVESSEMILTWADAHPVNPNQMTLHINQSVQMLMTMRILEGPNAGAFVRTSLEAYQTIEISPISH